MKKVKYLIPASLLALSYSAFSAGSAAVKQLSTGSKAPINVEISGGNTAAPEIDFDGLKQYSGQLGAQVRDLYPEQIGEIPVDQFSRIPPSALALLSNAQTAGITADQAKEMTGDQIVQLNSGQIRVLKDKLGNEVFDPLFSQLSQQQVIDFVVSSKPDELKKLTGKQLQKIDVNAFGRISNQQFLSFNPNQISDFTPGQVNSFNDDQLYWSYSRLSNKRDRDNFIAILNKESIARIIKFIPKSSYKDVFNAASSTALSGLLDSVKDSDKQFILMYLSPLTVLRVSDSLSESEINRLRPDQKVFLKSPGKAED